MDGSVIWQFEDKDKPENLVMDFYSTTFIPDQDGDKIAEVLASHTLQEGNINALKRFYQLYRILNVCSERKRLGHLLIVSGKTGTLLSKVSTPDGSESYYTPQLLNNETVIFGTGSPSNPGHLYVTSLQNLTSGNLVFITL